MTLELESNVSILRPMRVLVAAVLASLCACATRTPTADFKGQSRAALLADRVVATAYSGYRTGQHPGRSEPSDAELLEDLRLLAHNDNFALIRLYDSKETSRRTLSLIREHHLQIKVMLGAWLDAELSAHQTCAWLTEPIPEAKLAANTKDNAQEIERTIQLANEYSDIVVAVNVGNEVLVTWNDHLVSLESLVRYLQRVRAAIAQPVTVADNYLAWVDHPTLGQAVEFAGVHTYPIWENKSIDEAITFTIENLARVRAVHPNLPIVIAEAGWATVASEFPAQATEANQQRYFDELMGWASRHNITVFFFEAFDEDWKGDASDPRGAEKHWGLFTKERRPKAAVRGRYPDLNAPNSSQ